MVRRFIRNAISFLVFVPVVVFFPYGIFLVRDLLEDGLWVFPALYIGYVLVVAGVVFWRLVPRVLARRTRIAKQQRRESGEQ